MQTTLTIFAVAMALWLAFLAGAGKAAGLESAAESRAAPVTIVILPPDVKADDAETRVAAELLCDRLAEGLGDIAGIRVVDRTQIDRVLAEHALARKPAGPVLAYDAMACVDVDALRPVPHVRLRLIDFSMGNLLQTAEYPLKRDMSETTLAEMVKLCASAARAAADGAGGRIKVRIVGPGAVYTDARLEPLADRLKRVFEESVERSSGVCLVHHLEAATAKEEAVLVLMGLTRLPGGRAFAPQADATVEFRLVEVDAEGKSFDETTVRLEFRVEKGAPTEWSVVTGKVADWDRVIAEAWRIVAADLAGAVPDAAEGFLKEMAVRRRQARAEMERLRSLGAFRYPLIHNFRKESKAAARIEKIARTASVATKLDPTSEEAAFVEIKFNYALRRADTKQDKARARKILLPTIRDAIRYFRTFGDKTPHAGEVSEVALEAVHWILSPHYATGTPEALTVDTVAQLVELALDVPTASLWSTWYDGLNVRLVYENMLKVGVSRAACRRWRDRMLERCAAKIPSAAKQWQVGRHFELAYTSLTAMRISAALEAGEPERLKGLLAQAMETVPAPRHLYRRARAEIEGGARQVGDPKLVAKVSRWLENVGDYQGQVQALRLRWPAEDLEKDVAPPEVKGVALSVDLEGHDDFLLRPIGIIDDRLYLFFWRDRSCPTLMPVGHKYHPLRARFGYVPVDKVGRPRSQQVVLLPEPESPVESDVRAAKAIAGRLCIATSHTGVVVYDPRRNEWVSYGPVEGLPGWDIREIHGLDGSVVLCGVGYRGSGTFTLDLDSGRVVLWRKERRFLESLYAVWRTGDTWRGLLRSGVVEDVLARELIKRPWDPRTPHGWDRAKVMGSFRPHSSVLPPIVLARVKDRRFVAFPDTLREIDEQGELIREWGITHWANLEKTDYVTGELLRYYRVTVPGEVPGRLLVGSDGLCLYFVGFSGVSCFDPIADRWYGPVAVEGVRPSLIQSAHVVPGGVLYGAHPVVYAARAEIVAAAERAGLVASSEQLKQRLDERIRSASTFDRAKFAFSLRQFDEAKALLEQVLAEEPSNGEALIVMGLLHERHVLNNPEKALRYYETAAEVADTPSGVLAGMYLQFEWYLRAERPAEALAIGREMLTRFNLEANCHSRVQVAVNRLAAQVEGESK